MKPNGPPELSQHFIPKHMYIPGRSPRFSRLLRRDSGVCIKGCPRPCHPKAVTLATDQKRRTLRVLELLPSQLFTLFLPCRPYPPSLLRSSTTDQLKLSQGKIMMRKPGDWDCRCCQHLNFSRRDLCQQCGEPRNGDVRIDYGSFGIGPGAGGGPSIIGALRGADIARPGDWYCSCGYHNFASRANCLKCGGFKDESATGFEAGDPARPRVYSRVGWKTGDWICTRSDCNVHNYASRMECFRCHAPREFGTES